MSFIDVAAAVLAGNFFTFLVGYGLFRAFRPDGESRLMWIAVVAMLAFFAVGTAVSHEGLPHSVTNAFPPSWSE